MLSYLSLTTLSPTGVRHKPANRTPNRSIFIKPCLASFLPEHFLGSQCSMSHIATGNEINDSFEGSTSSTGDYFNIYYSKRKKSTKFILSNLPRRPCPILYLSPDGTFAPYREHVEVSSPIICSCSSSYVLTSFAAGVLSLIIFPTCIYHYLRQPGHNLREMKRDSGFRLPLMLRHRMESDCPIEILVLGIL